MHCGVGVQCLRKLSFQGEFCVIVKKKTGDQSSGDNKEQNVKKKKKSNDTSLNFYQDMSLHIALH